MDKLIIQRFLKKIKKSKKCWEWLNRVSLHEGGIFAYKNQGIFNACCLELNLVSQGKTIEEAVTRLESSINFYVKSEFKEGKTFSQIQRPLPFYFWMKFVYVVFRVMLSIVSLCFKTGHFFGKINDPYGIKVLNKRS